MEHKNFTKYFRGLTSKEKRELAAFCDVSVGHLRNVSYGFRRCSPELAVGIEVWSEGEVGRFDLVRNGHRIWGEMPELAKEA